SAAFLATRAFHSAAVLGTTFQIGLSGPAMRACIWGLTVAGTGMARAGTWRAPDCGCSADAGEKARAAISAAHQWFMSCPLLFDRLLHKHQLAEAVGIVRVGLHQARIRPLRKPAIGFGAVPAVHVGDPVIAGFGNGIVGQIGKGAPRDRHFQAPALILVAALVERAADRSRKLHARQVVVLYNALGKRIEIIIEDAAG